MAQKFENRDKNNLNKNNNQKNNLFQKRLSLFETKEENNENNEKLAVTKKENESKLLPSVNNKNKKENEDKSEKKIKDKEKENEKKVGFSNILNIFNTNKNENESKNIHLDKSKTIINNNNKIDNDVKPKTNEFLNNKKENEQNQIISEKKNVHIHSKKLSSDIDSKINKKESESKDFPIKKKDFDIIQKDNNSKELSTEQSNYNIKKNENTTNNFHKIKEQINNSKNDQNNNEIEPFLKQSTLTSYETKYKLNNCSNNNINNINNDNNTNLNINKIQEEKNYAKSSKNVIATPPSLKKTVSKIPISSNINNNDKELIGEIFLNSDIIPENVINDSFCLGFFITSFNIDDPQLIDNSNELCSDCGHNLCSSTLAIKPEIIFRYPEKDGKDFEISELGASICFPNGIKICYDKNEMHVKTLKIIQVF